MDWEQELIQQYGQTAQENRIDHFNRYPDAVQGYLDSRTSVQVTSGLLLAGVLGAVYFLNRSRKR